MPLPDGQGTDGATDVLEQLCGVWQAQASRYFGLVAPIP